MAISNKIKFEDLKKARNKAVGIVKGIQSGGVTENEKSYLQKYEKPLRTLEQTYQTRKKEQERTPEEKMIAENIAATNLQSEKDYKANQPKVSRTGVEYTEEDVVTIPKKEETVTETTPTDEITTEKVETTVPTDSQDTDQNYILSADELTNEEKAVYDILSETEKKQFEAIGENARKSGQDYVKAQLEYLANYKRNIGYIESQREKALAQQGISEDIEDIQMSQSLENTKQSLDNIKQNLAYLGSMGAPGKSSVRIATVDRQIANAEKTYSDLIKTQELYKEIKELGKESEIEQFEYQMENLKTDLDDKVNSAIQSAVNELNAQEILDKLETPEDLEKFRITLLQNLDEEITGITDANIKQRQFLIDRFDTIAQEKQQYYQNSQTVNSEMSAVKGYYVDGNGKPIIDSTTGQSIKVPDTAVYTNYDKDNGQLVSIYQDKDGNLRANVQQVIDQPTFEQQTILNYADLVNSGKLDINDVPKQIRNTDAFINAYATAETPRIPVNTINLGTKTRLYYADGTYEDIETSTLKDERYMNIGGGKVFDTKTAKIISDKDTTTTTPTGNLETAFLPTASSSGGVNVTMDNIAMPSITSALNEMYDQGISPNISQATGTFRTTDVQKGLKDTVQGRVADPNVSKHTQGLAVDLYGGVDAQGRLTAPTPEQVEIMKRNGFEQTYPEDDAGHFEYIGTGTTEDGMGAIGVPIEFERRIKNMVPATLMNSVVELEQLNLTIQKLYEQGYTADEAALVFQGYKINDNVDGVFANNLLKTISVAKNLKDVDVVGIARLLNAGKNESAVRKVENEALSQVNKDNLGNDKIREDKIITIVQRAKELAELIKQGENVVGPIEGTLQNWLSKFKSEEAQRIATKLTRLTAQMRNDLSGTAVTETEAKFLEPNIPSLSDSSENILIKVEDLQTEPLREFNNLRRLAGLDDLTEGELLDMTERVNKYKSTVEEQLPENNLSEINNTIFLDISEF